MIEITDDEEIIKLGVVYNDDAIFAMILTTTAGNVYELGSDYR